MVVGESVLPAGAFGSGKADMTIVYDGECPFCRNFVAMQKLRESAGTVALADARDHLADVATANAAGLDLDEAMLVFWKGQIYAGGDAINIMARMGAGSAFPLLTRLLFGSATIARITYPFLRSARNLTLRLMGKKKLNT